MICQNCGYKNDTDAKFCEKCGVRLSQQPLIRNDQIPPERGMKTSTKVLIVIIIVLVAGISVVVGMLLQINKAPVANTTDIQTNNDNNPSVGTNVVSGPKLIDSGSTSISDSPIVDGPFTYNWKTYENSANDLMITSTYVSSSKTITQTATLKKQEEGYVLITVEPKASGTSSWASRTTLQGYSTVLDYYWGYFKNSLVTNGPIH